VYTQKQVDALIRVGIYHGSLGHTVLFIEHINYGQGVLVKIYFDTSNQDSLDYSMQIVHITHTGKGY
jgi:dethiobiotin synthetase